MSSTVLPTPRRPVSSRLLSGRLANTRPDNSGGGEPAPGVHVQGDYGN